MEGDAAVMVASTDAELVLTSSLRVWEATRQAVQSALNKHGLGFGRFTTVCAAAAQHPMAILCLSVALLSPSLRCAWWGQRSTVL